MTHSILQRASKALIASEPFPHLVIEDALPRDYYDELEACYPDLDQVARDEDVGSNKHFFLSAGSVIGSPAFPEIWQDFFSFHCSRKFYDEVCDLWDDVVSDLHPGFERNFGRSLREMTVGLREPGRQDNPHNLSADVMLDCQFGMNSPVLTPSSVRGPHTDHRGKLYAGLLYFRSPNDDSQGGDLQLLRRRLHPRLMLKPTRPSSRQVECAVTVPYTPNTFVMWINAFSSLHAVTERSVTKWPRRYINFLGECYGGEREGYFLRPARFKRT